MESENETRPLLRSIDNESWRSRTRRRCLRIPSEITITGIILGLFLIVVTLLIVLENVETERKDELTLDGNLLASPFKYNKKVEDQSWQDDKRADKSWQDAKEMKLKNKEQKWDKVNKGFKVSPSLSASPLKYNKTVEDPSWQGKSWQEWKEMKLKNKQLKLDKLSEGLKALDDPSWQGWKEMKLKNKQLKLDKVNKGFKTLEAPSWLGESWQELKEMRLKDKQLKLDKLSESLKTLEDPSWQGWKEMKLKNRQLKLDKVINGFKTFPFLSGITSNLAEEEKDEAAKLGISAFDDYGKEIDDSLETHVELQMSDPNAMRKYKEDFLEIQNMLHSNIKWRLIDEGWKTLSEQGWEEWQIRRALSKALKEKRLQLKREESVLQSPMNFGQIWDNLIEHWKKNIDEGKEIADNQNMIGNKEAEYQKSINDDLKNEMNILQSPKSDIKNYMKEDEGWQKLTEQGWKNKNIVESLINAWKEQQNVSLQQSPMNIDSLFGKATDFFKSIFAKGAGEGSSQMAINDEWSKKFNNLQSPMSSSMKSGKAEKKKKHSKDDWKDKITGKIVNETDQILQSSPKFEDLILERIIEAIKEHKKDNKEDEDQIDSKEDSKKNPEVSYTSKQADKKWKQIDDHWKTLSEHERNSFFGRNDGDVTLEPKEDTLQRSMPLNNEKMWKINDGWKKRIDQDLKDQNIKEAVDKAWKDSNRLLQSSVGFNDYKWKKVENGWKTISNKS